MARKGLRAHENVVLGILMPIMLSGCFMDDPVASADVTDLSPPSGTNSAPDLWGNAPRVVKVGVLYSFTPQATDPDDDPLVFTVVNKPVWLAFDSNNGRVFGIPQSEHVGTYNDITISASDGLFSTKLRPFSVSVEPSTVANMPPEIDGTPDSSVIVGENYRFTPAGSDPDGDPLVYSIQNRPNWTFFDTASGELSGTPELSDIGIYGEIAITVSDGTVSSSLPAFSISVVSANSAPQISGTPSSSVNVGRDYSFTPTAVDPDGDKLTFGIENMPEWAHFDTATGTLSGTPQNGDEGSYNSILISVTDGNGSDALPEFTITVNQVSFGSATLSWLPPTENTDGSPLTDLAGYKIYYGTVPGNYPNEITITNPGVTSYVVGNLSIGTWFFVTTSFNTSAIESEFSNVVTRDIN